MSGVGGGGGDAAAVAVVAVGEEPLGIPARAALAVARRVVATRVDLRAVRGLVPGGALVDVLGDTAFDDLEGHRWDLPDDPTGVVVLTPAGPVHRRVTGALSDLLGAGRVVGYPAEPAGAPPAVAGLDPGDVDAVSPSRWTPEAWALDGDAFAGPDGTVPGVAVRALALAWLGPGPGDLVWDVCAGSGSVAVECGRLGAEAVAVERDAGRCEVARANAERHAAPVTVVEGTAPAVLVDLPDPDAVFVGGGDDLPAVLAAAAAREPRVVVVTPATVEQAGPARRALADAGLVVDGVLLRASPLAPTGGDVPTAPGDPVVVLRGRRP